MRKKKNALSDCAVFFDFDNTITSFDVLDDIVERFSVNKKWMDFEDDWKKGKIGSRECLSGQLKSVRIEKKDLKRYLSGIKIDPYFKRILALLKKRRLAPVILSDSFSFFLKYILKNNGVRPLRIYSNKIRFSGNRLIPSFPHTHSVCAICGNCKKKHLSKNGALDKVIIYVGDGLSDLCPAKEADIVFAKGNLKRYLAKEGKSFFGFDSLKNVYEFLRRV
jgi:2-hydroxy-3-keto-5-methylthiopentenyl-1-phosphate phosphatase